MSENKTELATTSETLAAAVKNLWNESGTAAVDDLFLRIRSEFGDYEYLSMLDRVMALDPYPKELGKNEGQE